MGLVIEPSGNKHPRSPMTDHTQYHESCTLRVLAGAWPTDVSGHLFVTGPDIATGVPLFGSDGMLYRFDLLPTCMVVRSCSLRTPSGEAALAAHEDKLGASARFRSVGLSRLSPVLGAVECLSVAPVPVGERLWVTSDAGRPWEVDPVSLRLLSPVGGREDWKSVTPLPWAFPLLLSSGHPAVDVDGAVVWEANFSNMSSPGNPAFFRLLRVVDGAVRSWEVVDAATGRPAHIHQSVHQMASTERFVVLLDAAFHVEAKQLVVEGLRSMLPLPANFLAGYATEAQRSEAVFWVIDKAEVVDGAATVPARRYALDGEATHFAAAWSEVEGAVKVVVLHTPCQDVSEWIRSGERTVAGEVAHPDLVGMPAGVPMAQGAVGVHLLRPDGTVSSELLQHDPATWGPALFTLPPGQLTDLEHFWYYTAGFVAEALPQRLLDTYRQRLGEQGLARIPLAEGRPACMVHVDLRTGAFDVWQPPAGWGVFGMCFVPKRGAASPWEGYLFVSALSDSHPGLPEGSKGDEIWVFDAQRVAAGPLCRLGAPDFNLPFTLHTAWVPRLRQLAPASPVDLEREHDPHAAITAWGTSLTAPAWVRRSLEGLARWWMQPERTAAFLDERVWPKFRR
jgi:carotenoid cleavage dioxygenase-like enzyme